MYQAVEVSTQLLCNTNDETFSKQTHRLLEKEAPLQYVLVQFSSLPLLFSKPLNVTVKCSLT